MKIIILLIFCAIAIAQCQEHEHGHHHHGHEHGHHGHDHGHHGHEHGHHGHEHGHHGHEHGHHGHDHGHHHHGHEDEDLQDQAKFRYSKQANKHVVDPPAVVPPVPVEEDHAEGEDHHDHDDKHVEADHSHSHEDGHKDEKSPDHTHKDENTHKEGIQKDDHSHKDENTHKEGIKKDDHSHSHEDSHKNEQGHGHSHGHSHSHGQKAKKGVKAPVSWLEPLLATAMISAAPFLILFIVPLSNNSPESQPLLKVLLSFASGGLLGDAFLHLIPHAISPHHHHGEGDSHGECDQPGELGHAHGAHDHTGDMIVGLWVLAGIIAFLCVEKFVRFIKGGHSHSHGDSHAHTEEAEKEEENTEDNTEDDGKKMNGLVKDGGDKNSEETSEGEVKAVVEVPPQKEIKISAYLNLVADCSHNFTDGLAIGASFLVSRNVGLITTLTIFLHEIPHEIGDFAILVQSGCTKQKAMYLQLLTAIGAFAGCICGLLAEGLGTAASAWILPFTAGGFIYIATVSVIPELLETTKLSQSIKEIMGLLVGVFLMVIIAMTE